MLSGDVTIYDGVYAVPNPFLVVIVVGDDGSELLPALRDRCIYHVHVPTTPLPRPPMGPSVAPMLSSEVRPCAMGMRLLRTILTACTTSTAVQDLATLREAFSRVYLDHDVAMYIRDVALAVRSNTHVLDGITVRATEDLRAASGCVTAAPQRSARRRRRCGERSRRIRRRLHCIAPPASKRLLRATTLWCRTMFWPSRRRFSAIALCLMRYRMPA